MPLSLTDRAPEVAMKTAGGAAARGDGALRRQPDGSACRIHCWARTREDPFCRWRSEIWSLGVRFGAVVRLGGRA
jgi:hypothetical protein